MHTLMAYSKAHALYNDSMKPAPSNAVIITFTVAAALKIAGVIIAVSTAYVTTGTWALNRWWMALASGLILLLLVLPWWRWRQPVNPKRAHYQLIVALVFAITMHLFDLAMSSAVPITDLENNQRFIELLGWSQQEINNVHALGSLFTMVPVVLASWQYGVWGMILSLAYAGLLYVITPLFVPDDAFNWWFYSVRGFVLLGVTLILAFVVGTLASAQRRKTREIASANERLAQQAAIMEQLATSRERNRLARELHDTIAHALSGTAVQLQAVGTLLKLNPEAASAELKTAQQQIKSGLSEARRAIAALRSTPLEELGLTEAIHQRALNLAERAGFESQLELEEMPQLPPLTEQTLYRVFDEALVNAEKYSQAKTLTVRLVKRHPHIELTVHDDGVGFDQVKAVSDETFGLLGMAERAELVGGKLDIRSTPNEGTTVHLTVPQTIF